MAQIEDIREIQGIDPILEETGSRIKSADPNLLPDDPDSVRSVLKNALTRLDDLVDAHNRETDHEIENSQIEELKVDAEDGFFSAREKLALANSSFYESGKLDAALITEILLDYASGYHLYTQFCSGGDAVDIVDRWNAVNEGNQVNCPQMVTSQNGFMQLVGTSLAPHTVTGDATRSFFETLQDRGFLRFGPQVFYQRNKERFYRGVGIYGEGVVSVKEDSPWFAGALLQINGQNSYDGAADSPFKGELKTTEWSIVPPLLEVGYQAAWWSASILAGGWFTAPLIAPSERENVPYVDNLFKNPNFLAGIRGTLLDHRLGLGVDYSYTPWGSQYALTTDVDLNFWRSK